MEDVNLHNTTPIVLPAPPEQTLALIKREEIESYRLETIDLRQPADDEIVIRVDAVALCGSDIVLYKWNDVAKTIASLPFVPGHEVTGTIVSVGSSAFVSSSTATSSSSVSTVESGQRLLPGQRICVENHFYCGQCALCDENRGDICLDMGQFGHGKKTDQGGCSQYAIVPARYCFPITTNISVDEAVLLEPLGVAHNAVEQLEVKGQDVLVLGCGPIGLLACSVASALGAKRVIAADIVASRLDLARKMKADVTINMKTEDLRQAIDRLTNSQGVTRILEATGAESVIGTMFSLLRKGGHVVMVGLPKSSIHIDSPAQNILFKSLQLRSIHGRRIYHTWEECERLIADGTIDVLPIVSHKLPMTRYAEAFDALISGQACKIIIDPQQ